MNYVKRLSLALLVIGASPVVFASEEADKAAKAAEEAAKAAKTAAEETAKAAADEAAKAAKTAADKVAAEKVAFSKDPVAWYKGQSSTVKVGIPVAVAGTAFAAAYYFIPEVKKATHKAIDKAKAFANEAIENPEGSNARRNAIIAGGLVVVAGGVYWKFDAIKKALKTETPEEKVAREAKEAKDKAEKEAKEAKDKADKEAKEAKDKADKEAKEAKEKKGKKDGAKDGATN